MKNLLIPTALALILPVGLAYFGLSKYLGAHIWWDVKTIAIGAPIGLVIGFLSGFLPVRPTAKTVLFIGLTLAAYGLAKYGQTAFANSYAEDQLAGQLWFFGWVATGVFLAAAIFTAARR